MTATEFIDLLELALEIQVEYQGQHDREEGSTQKFILAAKVAAMVEFIQRVQYKLNGEKG